MKKVVDERKDIAFFIKIFHPPMPSEVYEKSKAIACAKSLKVLEDAYAGKLVPKADCGPGILERNFEVAEKLQIRGTPSLIFPNGKVVLGEMKSEEILKLVGE